MSRIYLTSLFIIVACFLLQSFGTEKQPEPIQSVRAQWINGLEQWEEALYAYADAAQQLNEQPSNVKALQKAHLNTRLAFKKIEFLIEYIDPYLSKKSFNGAPLPYVEPSVPVVNELDPHGLQVMDELAFSEDVFAEKAAIINEIKQLQIALQAVKAQWEAYPLQHRHVFEASRRELVRIFTLGVTGFDTPGSVNALPEAAAAFSGVDAAIRSYLPLIEQKDRGMAILVDARLSYTQDFLNNPNHQFDSFDRLHFLTKHINPLYEILYRCHRLLGIETIEEVENLPQPVNYHAINIFDSTFLQAGFYANVKTQTAIYPKQVALGRLLFFDPLLSNDSKSSCATCHQPGKAFTDGLAKSKSLRNDGSTVKRNAPTLLNCVFTENFFYDFREGKLESQIAHVVYDSSEFNTDYLKIAERLSQSTRYKQLFAEAFPNEPRSATIAGQQVSQALTAYVTQLVALDSPFDQYVKGTTGVIDSSVVRGFNLFMGKAACGTCHFAPIFNGTVPPVYVESESEVLGVPATAAEQGAAVDPDLGRYANQKPRDQASFFRYSFKTPTVRNVALTAPYMHNGVYQTLEQVVDFYNKGGGKGFGIDLPHQTLPFDNLSLSAAEQRDLVAFMQSLTDTKTRHTAPDSLPRFEQRPEWNQRYQPNQYR
jgi:cytochrome c peroxidase